MSDIPIGDPGKPMEQPNNDLSEAIKQPSVATSKISSSSKNLCDMPIHVAGLIIERSDYKEQLKLRKVSKSLRELVDKQRPTCKSIQIACCMKNIKIMFNNQIVLYTEDLEDHEIYDVLVVKDDFLKVAFDDLTSTLKNPKLQLEELSVFYHVVFKGDFDKYTNEIKCLMKSMNHQISVKEFKTNVLNPVSFLTVLPYLKPGVLKIISYRLYIEYRHWRSDSTGMDQVALLEQWKQAEELELHDFFDRFPLRHATNFKRFLIREHVINTNTFDRIKKFLTELEDFEYCRITHFGRIYIEDAQRMIGTPVPPNLSHYSIRDSDSCLEFSFAFDNITIVKKMCHLH